MRVGEEVLSTEYGRKNVEIRDSSACVCVCVAFVYNSTIIIRIL